MDVSHAMHHVACWWIDIEPPRLIHFVHETPLGLLGRASVFKLAGPPCSNALDYHYRHGEPCGDVDPAAGFSLHLRATAMDSDEEPKPKRRFHEASKAAMQRWWLWKMRRWAFEVGRAMARHRIRWAERERTKALTQTFDTIKALTIKTEHGRLQSTHVLNKVALYLLIAARDIQVAKLDALTHPDEWTRRLHARVILLTVYEWDMDGITGRVLTKAMNTM